MDTSVPHTTQNIEPTQLNKNILLVACLTFISRILGFIRIGVISYFFGATSHADVLNLILSIPNNLRKLLGEGALHNSYMPSFANTIGTSSRANQKSMHFMRELLLWVSTSTLIIVVLLSMFSKKLTALLFNFPSDQLYTLASSLFAIAIYFLWLITISSILSGLLQTHKRFIFPAISPIITSIAIIASIFLFHAQHTIFSVVYGYLIGGALQVIILVIPVCLLGYKIYNIPLHRRHTPRSIFSTEFKNTLHRFPIITLAVVLPIVGQQFAFYFASTLPVGSSSAFSYAIVFWQLPIGIIINSLVSVTFTYLLTIVKTRKDKEFSNCVENGIKQLAIYLIPTTIIIMFFAHAGVAIALQRGNMTEEAAYLTSRILQGYGIGLFPMGLYLLFQKTLYSLQKNMHVFIITVIFTITDICISYILINTHLLVRGLSIAYTLSLLLILPVAYLYIKPKLSISNIPGKLCKLVVANLPLTIVAIVASKMTENLWFKGSEITNIIIFIILSIVIMSMVIIGYRLVGINIIKMNTRKQVR